MAYSKYVTQFKDKDNNLYGVMDEECRLSKADIITVNDTTPEAVKTFADGADGMPMGLTVGIEPVQDLHGYDNPWPAGGSTNKFNPSSYQLRTHNGITATLDGEEVVLNGKADGGTAYINILALTPGIVSDRAIWTAISNKTGSVALQMKQTGGGGGTSNKVFTDDTEVSSMFYNIASDSSFSGYFSVAQGVELNNFRIKMCLVFYNTGETAPGYTPYSNICPISGWTGAEVTRTGKNLYSRENGEYNIPVYSTEGTTTAFADVNVVWIPVKPNTKYSITLKSNANSYYVRWIECDENKGYVWRDPSTMNSSTTTQRTYTTKSATSYLQIAANQWNAGSLSKNDWEFCIKEGTDTTYEEYRGETYSIAFPSEAGTVYGGTLTVNADGTGTLVVDRAYREYTGASSENWNYEYTSNLKNFYIAVSDAKAGQARPNVISNCYKAADNIALQRDRIHISNAKNLNVAAGDTLGIDNVSDWKTYLASHNLQVVYFLVTPQTYTLSAPQVETLKGMNNLWADTGDIKAVDYHADTKLFVEGKISDSMKLIALLLTANHEDGMKASKAYASGDLLTVGNTLYKATTSIANGATLTAGTNVTATTIAQELAALA